MVFNKEASHGVGRGLGNETLSSGAESGAEDKLSDDGDNEPNLDSVVVEDRRRKVKKSTIMSPPNDPSDHAFMKLED